MPPRPPAHVEAIAVSPNKEEDDVDTDAAGLQQTVNGQQAPQFSNPGRLQTPVLDDDSDWGAVLNFTPEQEATENAQPDRVVEMTKDDCLARILEIFPEISHQHVQQLFRAKRKAGKEASASMCDVLIEEILNGGDYPTERQVRRENLKRKYRGSSEESDYNRPSEDKAQGSRYKTLAHHLFLKEFPYVPKRFITETLDITQSAFQTYLVIEKAERQYSTALAKDRPYRRVVKPRKDLDIGCPPTDATLCSVKKEMAAAKKRVKKDARKLEAEQLKALAEERNEAAARASNDMTECGCCFGEYPTNRMTFCNGERVHFFCHSCANSYVGTEIGQRKCRPKCMDTGGCDADFSRSQLKAFLDDKTFEILERLQQQEDLRNAGIEGLDECPFCDFKMICDPKEVDREFRCHNEDCAVVSCRLCRQETHVPLTCEQAAKDKKIDVRHKVEEAMTAALIRECNKCKNKFIKDYGCNKMTCFTCKNLQCYVCSKDVKNYEHFGDNPGQCPLYENTEKRHEQEVQKAGKVAFEGLKKENPNISEEDLKIQVSEAVKKADQERIARGDRQGARPQVHNREDIYARYVAMNRPLLPPFNRFQQVARAARPAVEAAAGQGNVDNRCHRAALDALLARHNDLMPDWRIFNARRTCYCRRYRDAPAPAPAPAPANMAPGAALDPYMGAQMFPAPRFVDPQWLVGQPVFPPPLAQDVVPAHATMENMLRQQFGLVGNVQARLNENHRQRVQDLEARDREMLRMRQNVQDPQNPQDQANGLAGQAHRRARINRQANRALADAQEIMARHPSR